MAHEAHYVFLLCRSNLDVPKHKGMTMFLVPMDTPGIEITPVETMGGERTNITFYSDVHIPDSCRVGDVDDGWSVMHAALVYERNSANWGEPDHLVESMARWATASGTTATGRSTTRPSRRSWPAGRRSSRSAGCCCTGRPGCRRRARCRRSRARWRSSTSPRPSCGRRPSCSTSSGPTGLVPMGERRHRPRRPRRARFRHAVVTTIYGGSSEVQREIIAGRGLGLPRNR